MPDLRKDPLTGRWVIIATERAKRPRDFHNDSARLESSYSPFSAGNEAATPPEIRRYSDGRDPDGADWTVRVIPNKFPALRVEGEMGGHADGVYDAMDGVGAHEVIIETPRQGEQLEELPDWHMELVLHAWRDRIVDLKNDKRLKCAVVFKNHGAAAGASLEHAHSQLIALPLVTTELELEFAHSSAYMNLRGRSVFTDMIAQELDAQERVVYEDAHVVAITPYASRHPFEVWLMPRAPYAAFEVSDQPTIGATARALKAVLVKLAAALDHPSYNMMLYSAPFGAEHAPHYRWRLRVQPKLYRLAGFEHASGFTINPTPPEVAARHLREIDSTGR